MKTSLTLFLLCIISSISFAQEINYGFKLGGNLSNLVGDYPEDTNPEISSDNKSKLGVNVGVFLEYEINDDFSFQPELLLSTQGNTYEVVEKYFGDLTNQMEKTTITQNTKLTYINLPFLVKYHLNEKFDIEFGPQVGYLISAKADFDYKDANFPEDNESLTVDLLNDGTYNFFGQTVNFQEGVNRFDFGLNFGGAYAISETLFVQARYYYGLSTIDDSSTNNQDFSSWNLKNSVFQLSVGYRL